MLYLDIEDIVANAMIELNKIDGSRSVPIWVAEQYGNEVSRYLGNQGYYTKMRINRERTYRFEEQYGEFFTSYQQGKEKGYVLNDGKDIEDLVRKFRGYLDLEVILAFINPQATETLQTYSDSVKDFELVKEDFRSSEVLKLRDSELTPISVRDRYSTLYEACSEYPTLELVPNNGVHVKESLVLEIGEKYANNGFVEQFGILPEDRKKLQRVRKSTTTK